MSQVISNGNFLDYQEKLRLLHKLSAKLNQRIPFKLQKYLQSGKPRLDEIRCVSTEFRKLNNVDKTVQCDIHGYNTHDHGWYSNRSKITDTKKIADYVVETNGKWNDQKIGQILFLEIDAEAVGNEQPFDNCFIESLETDASNKVIMKVFSEENIAVMIFGNDFEAGKKTRVTIRPMSALNIRLVVELVVLGSKVDFELTTIEMD